MAKRKQSSPPVDTKWVRWGAVAVVVLVAGFLTFLAFSSFLKNSDLFLVKEIAVDEGLGEVKIPELDKMKGRNIFVLDLSKVEEKVRSKYPRLGGLEVLRRFPDQIAVVGFKRESVALAFLGGKSLVISRDGFFTGAPQASDDELPVIKGLKTSKASAGFPVGDEQLSWAFDLIDQVRGDGTLSGRLKSLSIDDPTRVVLVFTGEKVSFEVLLDREKALSQVKILSGIIGRTELDLASVKYIDLRFEQPIVGRKKTGKK